MEKNQRFRHSGLFLLELMIAILLFSAASAVCAQVFAKAHSLSNQAMDLTNSVNLCSSTAEIIRGAQSQEQIPELLGQAYPDLQVHRSFWQVPLDRGCLEIRQSPMGRLYCARIAALNEDGQEIYVLNLQRYFPEEKK